MNKEVVCIACSIFRSQLEKIQDKMSMDIIYLDSKLHMNPEKLYEKLTALINRHMDKNIILIYGDCHPGINNLQKKKNIYRIPGLNCINIVTTDNNYKQLRKDGAFVLMDEWLDRWKEFFQEELGFTNQEVARTFMQDMHSFLVYFDTGSCEVPRKILDEISRYFDLPYTVEKINSNILFDKMKNAVNWFANENR